MSKYMEKVPYLEATDFNPDMTIKSHVNKGRPIVLMCQSLGCGYCTQAKPAFADFARQATNVMACTLQMDAEPAVAKKIPMLDKGFRGVPTYLGFNKAGKYVKTHSGGRDKASLLAFANSLK